jgi:hypothetical protein
MMGQTGSPSSGTLPSGSSSQGGFGISYKISKKRDLSALTGHNSDDQ